MPVSSILTGAIQAALDALTAVPEVPVLSGRVTVKSGTWNIRTGPGTEYPTAGKVKAGTVLERLEVDGWIPVLYNGEPMYISASGVEGG